MNRFKIHSGDLKKVISHLESGEPITKNDIGLPGWAHLLEKPEVRKVAHGEKALFSRSKQVISLDSLEGLLRKVLLSPDSDVPMSRDAGYHIMKQRYIGVSRRAFLAFMSKQKDLQLTQNRVNQTKREGKKITRRGELEMDLIEGKKQDVRGLSKAYNWYWLMVVDRLTGFGEVETFTKKTAANTSKALERILDRMEAGLQTSVKTIFSDAGSEFFGKTKLLMERRGIHHRIVARGNKVEKSNATFQRIFYRLYRLKRGTFGQLTQQAITIFNNTLSIHGHTPREALAVPDSVLSVPYNARRSSAARAKGPNTRELHVGDPVRYLLKPRDKESTFYKAYRGKHYSLDVLKISTVSTDAVPRYYLKGAGWKHRDELMYAPSDTKTEAILKKKKHSRY